MHVHGRHMLKPKRFDFNGSLLSKFTEVTCNVVPNKAHRNTMAFLSAVLVLACVLLSRASTGRNQDYAEELFISHLPDGRVMAVFEFATTWDMHPLLFSHHNGGGCFVHHHGIVQPYRPQAA